MRSIIIKCKALKLVAPGSGLHLPSWRPETLWIS